MFSEVVQRLKTKSILQENDRGKMVRVLFVLGFLFKRKILGINQEMKMSCKIKLEGRGGG